MPLEDQRAAEAREWLEKALLDHRAAEVGLAAEPPLTADVVFHCQQLVEKTMKCCLAWHDVPFRRTHNLVEIGEQCAHIEPGLEDLMRRAAPLSEYAWRFRYPGEPEQPTREEARDAFVLACEIHQAIASRLPSEVADISR